MSNIKKTLNILEACGCDDECKKDCKCKKGTTAFDEGKAAAMHDKPRRSPVKYQGDKIKKAQWYSGYDSKKNVSEGMMKRGLEAKVEKACTCDGGASLDPADHKKGCKALKVIDGSSMGDEIDAAEYRKGDR